MKIAGLKKLISVYRAIAIIFATTVFLLIFIYAMLFIAEAVSSKYQKDSYGPIGLYGMPLLSKVYKGWDLGELRSMLWENWTRRYAFEPFTLYKEAPFRGKYVNVDPNGFRKVKNQGPWPPQPKALNIFLFGGSTIFNYGLPDDETIASYLQEYLISELKVPVHVYNFARAEYYSSQERILFESLLTDGRIPDIAVFIDGLNDMSFWGKGERPFMSSALRKAMEENADRRFYSAVAGLPVFRILQNQMMIRKIKNQKLRPATMNDVRSYAGKCANEYLANQQMIQAVSEKYGVKYLFVWQPIPSYKYEFFRRYDIFRSKNDFIVAELGYGLMESIWKPNFRGPAYLWLADMQQNDSKDLLYVDACHYNAVLSKRIAVDIGRKIVSENFAQAKVEKPTWDLVTRYLRASRG